MQDDILGYSIAQLHFYCLAVLGVLVLYVYNSCNDKHVFEV